MSSDRIIGFALTLSLALTVGGALPPLPAQTTEGRTGPEAPALSELPVEELQQVARWIARRSRPAEPPSRNLFTLGRDASQSVLADETPSAPLSASEPQESESPRAKLAGFLRRAAIGGGERVLAVIQLGRDSWLVEEGDEIDGFRVERIVVGESVELMELENARRLRLELSDSVRSEGSSRESLRDAPSR